MVTEMMYRDPPGAEFPLALACLDRIKPGNDSFWTVFGP